MRYIQPIDSAIVTVPSILNDTVALKEGDRVWVRGRGPGTFLQHIRRQHNRDWSIYWDTFWIKFDADDEPTSSPFTKELLCGYEPAIWKIPFGRRYEVLYRFITVVLYAIIAFIGYRFIALYNIPAVAMNIITLSFFAITVRELILLLVACIDPRPSNRLAYWLTPKWLFKTRSQGGV